MNNCLRLMLLTSTYRVFNVENEMKEQNKNHMKLKTPNHYKSISRAGHLQCPMTYIYYVQIVPSGNVDIFAIAQIFHNLKLGTQTACVQNYRYCTSYPSLKVHPWKRKHKKKKERKKDTSTSLIKFTMKLNCDNYLLDWFSNLITVSSTISCLLNNNMKNQKLQIKPVGRQNVVSWLYMYYKNDNQIQTSEA